MLHSAVVLWLVYLLILPTAVQGQTTDSVGTSSTEVTFSNGDIMLAGTLLIPAGTGPFPGVVIVHGSGTSDRSNPWTSAYARALVDRGIAVLYPDKRGSGESNGSWQEATFVDLADDAVAALDLLRKHPLLDSTRVGFIGFSQGGHVVPVAATRFPAASFVINISGSVVPMMEQIGDEILQMGKQEGLTERQLDTIRLIQEHAKYYVLTGEGWTVYAEALGEATEGDLGDTEVIRGFPTMPDSPAWDFLRTIGNFDPLPYWRKLEVPALFLYGGRDENVDVYKSADIIEDSLTLTGLAYTLLLMRNNRHALFRDDAMEFIARWISDGGID